MRTEKNGPHNYNTRSSTKIANHVKTFRTAPNMLKTNAEELITTHKGTDYLACMDPKKDTITVEPVSSHINCETTGKILGYRDLVNMDEPVWTNLRWNEPGRLSQGCGKHAGTDTI